MMGSGARVIIIHNSILTKLEGKVFPYQSLIVRLHDKCANQKIGIAWSR